MFPVFRTMTTKIVDTLGNTGLLNLHKTAFLCSRRIPPSAVLKCYDWAIVQRDAGRCVISGFHSRLEKDALHYLLKAIGEVLFRPERFSMINAKSRSARAGVYIGRAPSLHISLAGWQT